MVQPLMLLLSSINKEYGYDHPVDIMYLNRSDRSLVMSEADRLGRMSLDEDLVVMTTDVYGKPVVDTEQVVNGKYIKISDATAMMLTRIQEAYKVFKKSSANTVVDESTDDLGADSVILRLEGSPKFVYIYVYSVMESKGMDYSAKIGKLTEVYNAIIGHSQTTSNTDKFQFLSSRFETQSTEQFWLRMLMSDIMLHSGTSIAPLTSKDLDVVKQELRLMGFYGFVNPQKMYEDFANSRVNRKIDVNVSPEVTEYLRKVVKSGGADVA